MLDERREFERFDISLEAAIKTSKYAEELFAGIIKNVSAGGICFESPDIQPALNAPLELEVRLPARDAYVSMKGTIAWREQFNNRCLVGLELTETNNEAAREILKYAGPETGR